jgi:hypothetical protein
MVASTNATIALTISVAMRGTLPYALHPAPLTVPTVGHEPSSYGTTSNPRSNPTTSTPSEDAYQRFTGRGYCT